MRKISSAKMSSQLQQQIRSNTKKDNQRTSQSSWTDYDSCLKIAATHSYVVQCNLLHKSGLTSAKDVAQVTFFGNSICVEAPILNRHLRVMSKILLWNQCKNSGEFYLLGPNFLAVLCAACVMCRGLGECCVSAACGISDVSCSNTLGCTSDIESVFQLTHEVDGANEILALAS